jgi:hypothetical protein
MRRRGSRRWSGWRCCIGKRRGRCVLLFLFLSCLPALRLWYRWQTDEREKQILAGDDHPSHHSHSHPLRSRVPPGSLPPDQKSTATSGGRQRDPSSSSTTTSGLSLALLLKMLSDPSERVLRCDLELLAQISSTPSHPGGGGGEEEYFPQLMTSLLELFSTDRKLLETRGSLVIRQLCGSLNAERIYRTCAEILERDEVRFVSFFFLFVFLCASTQEKLI